MITSKFESDLLEAAFRGNTTLPANYYLGLCNNSDVDRSMTLDDIVEVVGNGYARIDCPRSASGWGEPIAQADCYAIRSKQVNFVATGNWTAFNRAFLCDVSSGTKGKLIAVSTPLPAEVALIKGTTYPVAFEFYLK